MRKSVLLGALLFGVTLAHAAVLNAPAPAFTLKNSQKQVRTLASYKGKVLVIDFWASWCATCQLELPQFERLAMEYKSRKLQIVAINVDTDRKAAKELLSKIALSTPHFEVLWDPKSKAVSTFNIEAMPTSFILDQAGIIRFVHSTYHEHDPAIWRKEIDGLLPAVLPPKH